MNDLYEKNGYTISTDKSKLDLRVIHDFLRNSYWAQNIPYETVVRAIENSLCFGLYQANKQLGFARVATDYCRIAYVMDVFILEPYRHRGLSKWLMECILAHPPLQEVRGWMLATQDAHGLYAQFGFTPLEKPEKYMQKRIPAPYGV
ncbi:MAG: N-acetyltransferase [Desulfobacteraceae bacterium]|nr:MAG: N-acetyltransferase [Desulfobacteraceae bacterium]